MRAAKSHVKKNPDAQAQVIAAAPDEAAYEQMSSLKALIYIDDEEMLGLVTETF